MSSEYERISAEMKISSCYRQAGTRFHGCKVTVFKSFKPDGNAFYQNCGNNIYSVIS